MIRLFDIKKDQVTMSDYEAPKQTPAVAEEASDKEQSNIMRQGPSLAKALLIGAVIGLPLVAAVYLRNKIKKG